MAILHFTQEDAQRAVLQQITPNHCGEVYIHLEPADNCEGLACGARLESSFASDDYARWLDYNERRPPMPLHSHLIVSGKNPDTRKSISPILVVRSNG